MVTSWKLILLREEGQDSETLRLRSCRDRMFRLFVNRGTAMQHVDGRQTLTCEAHESMQAKRRLRDDRHALEGRQDSHNNLNNLWLRASLLLGSRRAPQWFVQRETERLWENWLIAKTTFASP